MSWWEALKEVEEIKAKVCCCLESSAMAAAVVVRWAGAFAALLHALCVFILVSTTGTENFAK